MGSDLHQTIQGRRQMGMTNLIFGRQKCNIGPSMIFVLFSLTVYYMMVSNNGAVSAELYNGDLADLLYLERGVAPQKRYYDEDYGDVITAPSKRNEAINRIISRLRPTYSKRPRESKRGVDFGLTRGFSGAQALKHQLGLDAAAYRGGPGKRSGSK